MLKAKLGADQFPIPEQKRLSTDLFCTILGAIFALAMFIIATVMWNKGTSLNIQNHLKITSSPSTKTSMIMFAGMALSILLTPITKT